MNFATPQKAFLEVEALKCGYHKHLVLSEVSFTVCEGERWAIVGENGEGKSTLIKTVLGLIPSLGGKRTLHPKPSEISFVPQQPTRDFRMPMSVEDFVELGIPVGNRVPKGDRKKMVHAALSRLGLSQRKEDIGILSGGQFQRTILARALVSHPCIHFLDEPARGLDQKSNELFMEELQCCPKHTSPAIFMVLHDLRLLRKFFTHVLWLQNGVAAKIKADEIDSHAEFLSFLGRSR